MRHQATRLFSSTPPTSGAPLRPSIGKLKRFPRDPLPARPIMPVSSVVSKSRRSSMVECQRSGTARSPGEGRDWRARRDGSRGHPAQPRGAPWSDVSLRFPILRMARMLGLSGSTAIKVNGSLTSAIFRIRLELIAQRDRQESHVSADEELRYGKKHYPDANAGVSPNGFRWGGVGG
jgi:hypothetical protein